MFRQRSLCLFLGLFLISVSAFATTFRTIQITHLARFGKSESSYAFKGTVEKIEDQAGSRRVTFKVEDVISGKINPNQSLVLSFPDYSKPSGPVINYRLKIIQPTPVFKKGEKVVLFTTRNIHGQDFFFGGEEQTRFQVEEKNGKELIRNANHNRNLISSEPEEQKSTLRRKFEKSIQSSSQGQVGYDDFKKMIEENKSEGK